MAQDLERIQSRLDNIRSVVPILAALRTISLGSWQMALNRQRTMQPYTARLLGLLLLLLPHLGPHLNLRKPGVYRESISRWVLSLRKPRDAENVSERVIALVIGSERGLCGRYNATVMERVEHYREEQEARGVQIEWMALGARVIRAFQRQEQALAWSQGLPVTQLPAFDVASGLVGGWLARYEAYDIDAVDVLYNAYAGAGRYAPAVVRLLPPAWPEAASGSQTGVETAPAIIETDPLRMYARVIEQWSAISFYHILLGAAASEHSARFHLMESATQNADRLVEELTLELQSARRQAITREMQELAAGSGLVGNKLPAPGG